MSPVARVDISPAVLSNDCDEFHRADLGGPSQVLSDLTGVGPNKPMGYLPLFTLERYYQVDTDRLIGILNSVGIETSIEYGASHGGDACLYAYDRKALGQVIAANQPVIEAYGWSIEPAQFVSAVANQQVHIREELYRVIAEAFGDPSAMQMWQDSRD